MNGMDEAGCVLRPGTEKAKPGRKPAAHGKAVEEGGDSGEFLLCRQCFAMVTSASEKIMVNGAHAHSFTNPHGLFFDIGCFRHAVGCMYAHEGSYEFTWFPGFRWQVAVCRSCMAHLGWLFTSSGSRFNGLILDNLIPWKASDERPS